MGRKFNIPIFYRSSIISSLKQSRNSSDPRKKDLTPSVLDLGNVKIKVARHFGFCFGVENAIEIAYKALDENPGKRVFLLSEMIHNAHVNEDLISRGVKFLQTPEGGTLIDFSLLQPEDIVIVPAFGTTREIFSALEGKKVNPYLYNATCPFVEKVWKRAEQLGQKGYTVVIHGKYYHEETRATFSHAEKSAPSIVVRDMKQAQELIKFILDESVSAEFDAKYFGLVSKDFSPELHLRRIGVVNQTTMLAGETDEISQEIRKAMLKKFGEANINEHFADTKDTLCYATSENQEAMRSLIASGGDIAIVVGGYNSSNTSHLVALSQGVMPTFYIKDAGELINENEICHLDPQSKEIKKTYNWIPLKTIQTGTMEILLSAGASCPDALVDEVIVKLASFWGQEAQIDQALSLLN